MQNYYQKPIQRVSTEFKERFDDFFLANARKTNETSSNLNMPDFQKQLFIEQAIDNNSVVTLEMLAFNQSDETTTASGTISKLSQSRFLLKSSTNVSFFIDFNQIKYIKLK